MSSDGEEVSAMAYGLQLTGCGIFLVEQFSGISTGYREYRSYALEASKVVAKIGTWPR